MDERPNWDRLTVLVVDDSRHMLTLVKQVLHALGIGHILTAIDGVEAFKLMRDEPVDLIICDFKMEPIDGIEFTKLVRTSDDSPDRYVPIIMLTGHTERRLVKRARDAGITEYLAKPISAKTLYSHLIQVIEHPRPFVRAKGYTGPDRRRRQSKDNDPKRRETDREADPAATARDVDTWTTQSSKKA